jgi:hypothetical protein
MKFIFNRKKQVHKIQKRILRENGTESIELMEAFNFNKSTIQVSEIVSEADILYLNIESDASVLLLDFKDAQDYRVLFLNDNYWTVGSTFALNNENGFVIQTLIIGIGTWIASNLPWLVNKLGVSNEAAAGVIPPSVIVAFSVGAFVFFASILYTIITTNEDPPADLEKFKSEKKETRFIPDLIKSMKEMPPTMKKLGLIQFFSCSRLLKILQMN